MDEDALAQKFAQETGQDFEEVLERWDGKPENIIEDLFRVRDSTTRESRPLELFYPYQHKAIRAYFYGDSSTINVYKGRRIGMTFVYLLCLVLDAISHPKTFYPIVCPSGEASKKRIEDIYDILDMCVLDVVTPVDNAKKIVFWNGSQIEAFTGGSDSSRGDDPAKAVMLDEMAFLEDQAQTLRAFRAFIALGEGNKMIQISTPKVDNDKFMSTHSQGTETGYADDNGNAVEEDHPDAVPVPISIQQPSFWNPKSVDIHTSLHKQDIQPVRPDLSIDTIEDERASDPQGFAQEYLCRPLSNEYRFFRKEDIERAQSRGEVEGYQHGPLTGPQRGGTMVMSLDLAFGGSDDTVMCVWEHKGDARRGNRYLRHHEVIDEDTIRSAGVADPSKSNPNHVASRVGQIFDRLECAHLVYDETGGGQGFKDILREEVGRGVHPFNFSDYEAVNQMMLDFNYGLHNDNITLVSDDMMFDQLKAIVKKQDEDYNTPRYSGKDHAPGGKDDIAIALVLGAYPSMLADGKSNKLLDATDDEIQSGEGESSIRHLQEAGRNIGVDRSQYGGVAVSRADRKLNRRYNTRHERPRRISN